MEKRARQKIRYLTTPDGVKVAWAEAGEGQLVIKAATWLTHLDHEWQSPVWGHWVRFFADNFHFVRYDERGSGMTDRNLGDLSFDRWVEDLEAIVEAVGPTEPFALLGISQGAAVCIAYAARHPERVSKIILYGGYARGWRHRGDNDGEREYEAIVDLARVGWGRDNPVFRRVFTSRFIPEATEEQHAWFAELCRTTTSPEIAARLLRMRAEIDIEDQLPRVRAPTLVVHAREDAVCPIAEGRLLASGIPGAEFVEVDSKNHVVLDGEPAWDQFQKAVREFMGIVPASSEVFDKLGVSTRAQAIVLARDRGFRG